MPVRLTFTCNATLGVITAALRSSVWAGRRILVHSSHTGTFCKENDSPRENELLAVLLCVRVYMRFCFRTLKEVFVIDNGTENDIKLFFF